MVPHTYILTPYVPAVVKRLPHLSVLPASLRQIPARVCVCEREREGESDRERGRECVCLCVCVCVV